MPTGSILCVNRNPQIANQIRSGFQDRFQVQGASSGHEGLKLLARERFDWVILDFHLQDMSGGQFILSAFRSGARPRYVLQSKEPLTRKEWEGLGGLGVKGSMADTVDLLFLESVFNSTPSDDPEQANPDRLNRLRTSIRGVKRRAG